MHACPSLGCARSSLVDPPTHVFFCEHGAIHHAWRFLLNLKGDVWPFGCCLCNSASYHLGWLPWNVEMSVLMLLAQQS